MKKIKLLALLLLFSINAYAAEYKIDIKGAHASINFQVKHLGYSWLVGRFNKFDGNFTYDDKNPKNNKVSISIETASVDSNHSLRDKHLRGKDFLEVDKYPTATFTSTAFIAKGNGEFELKGKLDLHGVSKEITIKGKEIGAGKDPWGGYRRGFEGSTSFKLSDFGITKNLGPKSKDVLLKLHIEGIKQ